MVSDVEEKMPGKIIAGKAELQEPKVIIRERRNTSDDSRRKVIMRK